MSFRANDFKILIMINDYVSYNLRARYPAYELSQLYYLYLSPFHPLSGETNPTILLTAANGPRHQNSISTLLYRQLIFCE